MEFCRKSLGCFVGFWESAKVGQLEGMGSFRAADGNRARKLSRQNQR